MSHSEMEFRVRVSLDVFDLNIDIKSSKRVLGIFGPSGSGKTTLLESIVGLRAGAKGYIRCDERVWQDDQRGVYLDTSQRRIGYVPQDHLLFPHLSVKKNLEYGSRRFKGNIESATHAFNEVLDVLQLEDLLHRRISGLSGGEKQRVSLGRALCSNPDMLILDEPLSSLDLSLRHRILPFLIRIKEHFNLPIVLVSHNPTELQALADEIVAIDQGKVVAQGSATDVLTHVDVYGAASQEGYQNMLEGMLVGEQTHTVRVGLGSKGDGQELLVLKNDLAVRDRVLVGFPSNDILIATNQLTGISARNQIKATIAKIETVGHRQVITVVVVGSSPQKIIVELTSEAIEELHLKVESQVFLVIKSSSISLFG